MPTKPRAPRSTATLLQLKIVLQDSRPPIWRRIVVRNDMTLDWLHAVFQIAMGWTNSHLHQFFSGTDPGTEQPRYGMASVDSFDDSTLDERRFRISKLAPKPGAKFLYEYDFGDSWMHEVTVEKVLSSETVFKHAICLEGKKACPPEDCGGLWGYYRLLEILAKPKHPEHAEMKEWAGDAAAASFNLEAVNATLKYLGT